MRARKRLSRSSDAGSVTAVHCPRSGLVGLCSPRHVYTKDQTDQEGDWVSPFPMCRLSRPHVGFCRSLSPGSGNVLEYLAPKEGEPGALDLATCARKMNIEEWKLLLEAWGRWPFRPDVRARTESPEPLLILGRRRCQCYLFPKPPPKRPFLWLLIMLVINTVSLD